MRSKRFINYLEEVKSKSAPEGHRFFYSKNYLNMDEIDHSAPWALKKLYTFHIVPPERRMIKFNDSKYDPEAQYVNVSLPWQIFISSYLYNFNNKTYRHGGGVQYLFSHRNPLEAASLKKLDKRTNLFHMPYLPNVSIEGGICLGHLDSEFRNANSVYYPNISFELKDLVKEGVPEISLKFYELFFAGIFNPDYSSWNSRNTSNFHSLDKWFDSGWSISTVTKKNFYQELKSNNSARSNYNEFKRYLLENDFWDVVFKEI